MFQIVWSKIKKYTKIILFLAVFLFLPLYVFITQYGFLFKVKIIGEVQAVESVGVQALVTPSQNVLNPQVFSMSVAVKDLKTNEIHMASTEDRQWAAVQKGNCVVAAFFPYEPWKLKKGGTYHQARLIRNFTSCQDVPADYFSHGFWQWIKFFFLWD